MAKKANDDFGPDFWLHVATDGMRRYAEEGGEISVVVSGDDMVVTFANVTPADERVHGKFAALFEVEGVS